MNDINSHKDVTMNNTLTHETITLGMPVWCYTLPFEKDKKTGLKTQVISAPQFRDGKWCVLVANIGDWVPIEQLEEIKPYRRTKTKKEA